MAIENDARTSRRGILTAAIGGAGALAVSRLVGPGGARAADTGNAILGAANESSTETGFENTDAGEVSVHVKQTSGQAILAETTTGTAIRANATDATPTAFPVGSYRSAIVGTVGDLGTPGAADSIADNTDEVAIYGYSNVSDLSNGVMGDSWAGVGVQGVGSQGVVGAGYEGVVGVGVVGIRGYGDTYGLYGAPNLPTGYGLYTQGKIKFNGRSGRTTITSGHLYKDVSISGMTTGSAVIVTLQTYKSGYAVAAAVSYAGKFRMYLNKTATSTMSFSYLVIG